MTKACTSEASIEVGPRQEQEHEYCRAEEHSLTYRAVQKNRDDGFDYSVLSYASVPLNDAD